MISIEGDGCILFAIECDWARRVELVGAFDAWHLQRHPMRRDAEGMWRIRLKLVPGEHLFRYLINGRSWILDPDAHGSRQSLDGIPMSRVWQPPVRLNPDFLVA